MPVMTAAARREPSYFMPTSSTMSDKGPVSIVYWNWVSSTAIAAPMLISI